MLRGNKKAFTLTEIIATLAILGVIFAIAIPGVGKLQEKFRKDYYTQLDASVLAAGKNYYKDHQDKRPVNLLEADFAKYVNGTLVKDKYIDTVKKYNSDYEDCTGHVVVLKLEEGYKYVNCMNCGDYNTIPAAASSSNYDKNICLFSDSDYITSEYEVTSPFYIYVNDYDSETLKEKLCLYETVSRKESIENIVLYKIEDVNSEKKCPSNISGVDTSRVGVYKVQYGSEETSVNVFEHDAPSLVNDENVNIIGGIVYTKGKVSVALINTSTFGAIYNSELNTFQYFDGTSWKSNVTNDLDNFKATLNTTGYNKKNIKFRVLGEDKETSKVTQEGKESIEYKITGKQIRVNLDKKDGLGGTNTFQHWIGFSLDKIEIPIKSGYKFEGYYDSSNNQYYDSVGGVVKTDLILSTNDIYLEAKWSVLDKEKPTYDFLASDSSHNIFANNSNVEINKNINFNVVVAKAGTVAKEVKIIYHDGSTKICNVDNNSSFFNNFSGYTSSTHTRYYCGAKSYSTNGQYITNVEVKYDKNPTTEEVDTSSIKLIVPNYTLTYKNSTCGSLTKPYGATWGSLCQINKTGYTHSGWKTLAGVSVTASTKVTGDIEVYPEINANKYNITYNANGGKFNSDNLTSKVIKSTYNGYYQLPTENPVREGYEFIGWYISTSSTTKITSGTKMITAEAHTLYARWQEHSSTLIVDESNGSSKKEYTQKHNTTKDIYNPTKSSASSSASSYTVYFDYNGGSGSVASKVASRTKTTSYNFNSWSKSNPFYGTLTDKGTYNTYKFPPNKDVKSTITANYSSQDSYATAYITLPSSSRAGYTFGGWKNSSNQTYAAGASYQPSGNETLTAVWLANAYTIKYYKNDGTTNYTSISCQYDETYCYIGDYTRTGYTWTGWSSTTTGTITNSTYYTKSSSVQPGSEVKIYARWTQNESTLIVNPNGGSVVVDGSTITSSKSYTKTSGSTLSYGKPTKSSTTTSGSNYTVTLDYNYSGKNDEYLNASSTVTTTYTFNGWSKSSSFYGSMTSTSGSGTYTYGTGSGTSSTITASYSSSSSTTIGSVSLPTPTRSGYTFNGWYTSSSGGSKVSTTYTPSGATTLYARWTQNESILTVNPNGGSVTVDGSTITSSKSYTKTSGSTLSYGKPTKSSTTTSGSSYTVTLNYNYSGKSNEYLYASSTITTTYTFNGWSKSSSFYGSMTSTSGSGTYTYGTGSGTSSTITASYSSSSSTTIGSVSLPTPTRSGYTFDGWYTSSSGGSKVSTTYTPSGATTLYARWTQNESTLIVNPNGGSVVVDGSTITSSKSYTKTSGSTLSYGKPTKSSTTTSGSSYTVTLNYNYSGKSNEYLYASSTVTTTYTFNGWSKSSSFYGSMTSTSGSGTYTYGTGSGTSSTITASYSSSSSTTIGSVSLPTPTRSGYTFDGWYTSSSGGSKVSTTYTPSGATTLYAHWTVKKYTISYNANGGSGAPSSQTKTHGVNLTLSSTKPTRTGYSFRGWATSASSTSKAYSAGDNYTANSSQTLYAIWRKELTATFDPYLGDWASTTTESCYIYNAQTSCTVTIPSFSISGTNRRDESTSSTYNTKSNQNYSRILEFAGWYASSYKNDEKPSASATKYSSGSTLTLTADKTLYAYVRLKSTKCGSSYKYTAFDNDKNGLNFRDTPGTSATITGILITDGNPKVTVSCDSYFRYYSATGLWLRATKQSGTCNKNSSGDSGGDCSGEWVSADWLSFP